MEILALEPYYGGSHKAFLDGLKKHSSHNWTILGLPAYKWKWRMRHSAVTFAEQVDNLQKQARPVIFCSDMLNLAEFLGLVNNSLRDVPVVLYFHENQLTYPVQNPDQRDLHLAMINFTSCLTATEIWFNSKYHRTSYLNALEKFLGRMPDYQSLDKIKKIKEKSSVVYPGIDNISKKKIRGKERIRILWVARWEYDKDPETFFEAIRILKDRNIDFGLNVIGSKFSKIPPVFERAKEEFSKNIDCWGYRENREEYIEVLQSSDVVVSTAKHEFYGISIIEAISAGAYPLLPHRLSYPEILGEHNTEDFFYDGSVADLAQKLIQLDNKLIHKPDLWSESINKASQVVKKFQWEIVINNIDTKLSQLQTDNFI